MQKTPHNPHPLMLGRDPAAPTPRGASVSPAPASLPSLQGWAGGRTPSLTAACVLAAVIWLAVMLMLNAVNNRREFLPDHRDGIQVAPAASGSPSPARASAAGPRERGLGGEDLSPFALFCSPASADATALPAPVPVGKPRVSPAAAPPPVWQLETDPFRRCALKALGGEFGGLKPWKQRLYEEGLLRGLRADRVCKRTTYCPHCDPTGVFADGKRFALGNCAANHEIPLHSVVWLATDGFLTVRDRGGKVSTRYTRGRETANIDVFTWDCPGDCWTGPGTKREVPFLIAQVP